MTISVPFGAWPILTTPFTDEGSVDHPALDRVLDFYIEHHVPGMLALGQASEVLTLSTDERFEIARQVATRCKGHIFIAAVANYGSTLEEQAAAMRKIAGLGIDVPVVGLSLLPQLEAMEVQLLKLAELVGNDIQLGIYELPEPEHRLLSPEQVNVIAHSGRYVFMKDTCRQLDTFTAKVNAAKGTQLKIFQANLQILPASLNAGCQGFCGHTAMVAPELMAEVCNPAVAAEIRESGFNDLMEIQNTMRANNFPASAKYILKTLGVQIGTRCRVGPSVSFTTENEAAVNTFLAQKNWFALHLI
jgi:4-hydroxy-tetrahydrodipicolinate synthase